MSHLPSEGRPGRRLPADPVIIARPFAGAVGFLALRLSVQGMGIIGLRGDDSRMIDEPFHLWLWHCTNDIKCW